MASLVRLLAYSPETASMLPLLIHQTAQGHYEVPGYLARQMNEQLREILVHKSCDPSQNHYGSSVLALSYDQ